MMTALMAAIGLFPAAVSHGIGSESSRPLARVVIGGILCAMIFSLLVFPLIFAWAYRNVDTKHRGPIDGPPAPTTPPTPTTH
jgi:cobalt-zinc-cadmium resistance protein CzcA